MGLSLGGGATATFAAAYPTKAAAVVTMAEASGSKNTANAKGMASGNLPIWAFHNQYDPIVRCSNTINLINIIKSLAPFTPVKETIFHGVAEHNCWSKATDPNYKEDGMNIYEWMLQYTRTSVVERGREVNVGVANVRVRPR